MPARLNCLAHCILSSAAAGFLGSTGQFLESVPLPHEYGPEGLRAGAVVEPEAETPPQ